MESNAPANDIDAFEVTALGASTKESTTSWPRAGSARSLGILPPSGDPEEPIELKITARGRRELVAHRSITRFVEHASVNLYVCLETGKCEGDRNMCSTSIPDLRALDQQEEEAAFLSNCRPREATDAEPMFDVPDPDRDAESPELGPASDVGPPPDQGVPDSGIPPLTAWSARIGGRGHERMNDVLIDPSERVIVAGSFEGVLTFANVLYESNAENGFIAAYGNDGRELWFVQMRGLDQSRAWALALGQNDDLYIATTISSAVNVLSTTIAASPSDPDGDALVLHLSIGGPQVSNTPSLSGFVIGSAAGLQSARAIAVDRLGMVHVAGNYTGSFSFGGCGIPQRTTSQDIFWVIFEGGLLCREQHVFHTEESDSAEEMKTDPMSNDVVLGAEMGSDLYLDGTLTATAVGPDDIFTARLDTAGLRPIRTVRIGGFEPDNDPRINFDSNGTMHVAAKYEANMTLYIGTATVALGGLTAVDTELFPNGRHRVTTVPVLPGGTLARGVANLPNNSGVVIAGNYLDALMLGTDVLINNGPAGTADAFIAYARGGTIRGGFGFGSDDDDDDLVRVAASARAIVSVGTFTGTIAFPFGAESRASIGTQEDGFVFSIPAP